MNINQSNYENYFLLYVDGELSASEMQAVECFAAENIDLADELEMLLQTKLNDDKIIHFENKSTLYRTESDSINTINYEEQFLLLIDNELNETEKNKTLEFVLQNPNYSADLELLKQTKLPIETLSFPNKELLFRKEKTDKPFVFMQWRQMAAAAALIGLIVISGVLIFKKNEGADLAKDNHKFAAPVSTDKILQEQSNKNNGVTIRDNTASNNQVIPANEIVSDKLIASVDKNSEANNQSAIVQPETKEIIRSSAEPIAINTENTISQHHTIIPDQSSEAYHNIITASNNRVDETTVNNNNIHPAVYKELDTEDERKSLYVGSVELNRDKLRGFFRKASSIFKSRSKSEDDKSEYANNPSLK
ncbi:MAG: hypothetical protein K2Q21_11020 [Chitinophagaceae bacterium]|nr:hypothetical protein [Chitinophagaceae bacterium]